MKQLSVALLILSFTCFGFAKVKFGDYAYFSGSQVSKCGTSKLNLQRFLEVTEVNLSNAKVLVTEKYDLKPVTSYEYSFETANYPDGSSLQDLYNLKAYCAQIPKSSLEEITVPAGKFWTCHYLGKDGDSSVEVWLGPVALGIVKHRTTRTELNDPACVFEETTVLEKFSFAN